MIPGNKEIALIQHRMGPSSQLPDYLESAEIAFTTDTGEVFIGAPTIHTIDGRERSKSNIYPYHNIQLLTELTDNAKLIKTEYTIDGVKVYFPIIYTAINSPSSLSLSDTISINGISVNVGVGVTGNVNGIVSQINNSNIEGVTAYNVDNKIQLVVTDGLSLILQDISSNALFRVGLVEEGVTFKTIVPSSSYSRSLSDSISDRITLNTFGVSSTSDSDSSVLINSALKTVYVNDKTDAHKIIYANAGIYKLKNEPLYIPSNATIKGEGVEQTIFETDNSDFGYILAAMDDKGRPYGSPSFGLNSEQPKNIIIEDCCFRSNVDIDLIKLYGFKDITFRHCKFMGSGSLDNKLIDISRINGYSDISNIRFENCIFENGGFGIYCQDACKGLLLRDCSFSNMTNEMISLVPTRANLLSNILIENCTFNEKYESYYFNINANVSNCKIINPTVNQTTNTHNISSKCNIYSTSTELDYWNENSIVRQQNNVITPIVPGDTMIIEYILLHTNYSRKGTLVKSSNVVAGSDLVDTFPGLSDDELKWNLNGGNLIFNNTTDNNCRLQWKLKLLPKS